MRKAISIVAGTVAAVGFCTGLALATHNEPANAKKNEGMFVTA